RYGRADWLRAASIPGWAARLDELEAAYSKAWRAGGDPREELDDLTDHWRTGLEGYSNNQDNTFDLLGYVMTRMERDEQFLRLLPQLRRFLAKHLTTSEYRAVRAKYHGLVDGEQRGHEDA
ncbi:MAG: hypothetical protein AB7W37_18075, partial [Syntrophobacteraceae bacterium]